MVCSCTLCPTILVSSPTHAHEGVLTFNIRRWRLSANEFRMSLRHGERSRLPFARKLAAVGTHSNWPHHIQMALDRFADMTGATWGLEEREAWDRDRNRWEQEREGVWEEALEALLASQLECLSLVSLACESNRYLPRCLLRCMCLLSCQHRNQFSVLLIPCARELATKRGICLVGSRH